MAHDEFKNEVWILAEKIGVYPREIHLRKMKTKWASYSTGGRLTFDPSLLKEADEFRIKVIIHELLHSKYPNHGKMFKRLLDTYVKNELEK